MAEEKQHGTRKPPATTKTLEERVALAERRLARDAATRRRRLAQVTRRARQVVISI